MRLHRPLPETGNGLGRVVRYFPNDHAVLAKNFNDFRGEMVGARGIEPLTPTMSR